MGKTSFLERSKAVQVLLRVSLTVKGVASADDESASPAGRMEALTPFAVGGGFRRQLRTTVSGC
jgi:hypothetical protein